MNRWTKLLSNAQIYMNSIISWKIWGKGTIKFLNKFFWSYLES